MRLPRDLSGDSLAKTFASFGYEVSRREELARMLGRPVDLNIEKFLSRYFREAVLREAETVYDAA